VSDFFFVSDTFFVNDIYNDDIFVIVSTPQNFEFFIHNFDRPFVQMVNFVIFFFLKVGFCS
jgi:hypothetical protein